MFLTDDQKQTVKVLFNIVSIVESKRPYAIGHSKRVAELSRQMAEELGLSEDEVDRIFVAAMLHDIGYVALPDRVFQAPFSLGEAERELLRTHSRVGIHILGKADFLVGIRDIILQHHYRYDGQGNADGIKGDEIPLGARIIHLVETFEALTQSRPHRKALSGLKALQAIRRDRGRFDPRLVELFITILEKRLGAPLTATVEPEGMNELLTKALSAVLGEDGSSWGPPRPLMLVENLLQEDKATLTRVTKVLEQETSLGPLLVSAARSPLFGEDSKIENVSDALSRVGLEQAREILATILYQVLFSLADDEFRALMKQWWDQSLLTGTVCRGLAARGAKEQLPTAYCLGLLHNIGKPFFLQAFGRDWPGGDPGPENSRALVKFIDLNHRKAGERILAASGFREPLLKAVRSYGLSNPGGLAPESLLLNAAADVTGVIVSGEEIAAEKFRGVISAALLGLTSQDVEAAAKEAVSAWEMLKKLFPGPGGEEAAEGDGPPRIREGEGPGAG